MSIFNKASQFTKKFAKNVKGNVGITFAISAIPMAIAAGSAIDYAKASRADANLQAAVDNAALAAGYDTDMSNADMRALVVNYLKKNGANDALTSLDSITINKIGTTGLQVKAKGKLKTSFMGLVGYNQLDLGAETFIKNSYGNLEVALILDNTYSMAADGKMAALKNAAHTLVNKLHDNKGPSSELKIGLVPFAQYVNIGMSRRNAPWADVPADYDQTRHYSGYWYRPVISRSGCRTETRTGYRDGVAYTYDVNVCSNIVRGPRQWRAGGTWIQRHRWHGCVGSRANPLNIQDTNPGSKIPGLLNVNQCPREFTPLTDSKTDIKAEIDNMTADGNATYIPAGLMWGWRLISSDVPITDGVTKTEMKDDNYTKAIVLMTDGENTVSPSYPKHDINNGTEANRLTKKLCQNIKNDGTGAEKIRVYTVTFNVTDPATKTMMRNCATNSNYYFDASDSAALAAAFDKIGKSLVTLFISQ